ncbi:MAG: hypothetical protein QXT63_06730 [Thermoplasmata archaeon]
MDEGHIAIVEKNGSIMLPKVLLSELGIKAGDYLYVGKEHGSIVLLKLEQELVPSMQKLRSETSKKEVLESKEKNKKKKKSENKKKKEKKH